MKVFIIKIYYNIITVLLVLDPKCLKEYFNTYVLVKASAFFSFELVFFCLLSSSPRYSSSLASLSLYLHCNEYIDNNNFHLSKKICIIKDIIVIIIINIVTLGFLKKV